MHILAPPDLDIQLCLSLYHTMLVVRLSIGLFLLGLLAVDLLFLSMWFLPKSVSKLYGLGRPVRITISDVPLAISL